MESDNELLQKVLSHNIRVKSVKLEGLCKVKDDIVIPHVKPLLKPTNLYSLLGQINKTLGDLEGLDAFEAIDIKIDHLGKGDDINNVGLRIAVNEASRRKFGINLSSDQELNDGNFVLSAQLKNMFGRLESLKLDYTKGTKISDACTLSFNKPLLSKRKSNVSFISSKENAVNRTGGFMTSNCKSHILYQLNLLGGRNEFEVGALLQQIHGTNVPVKVREEFGHHLKCGVRHKYHRDTRDDNLVPTSGYRTFLETELAGFMGDVNHLKVNFESQVNFPLLVGYTGTLTLRGGAIKEMAGNPRTWITDKFFCGGPGSVRGFFADGIGRPLGGTAHWGAGLSLTRKLPFSPYIWGLGQFMRIHHFVNAGNLSVDRSELFKDPRLSVGSGVIIKVGGHLKMEINYAVPLRHSPGDVLNHGLQFGIGVEFM